jgi:pilus assembly protein CpaC
LYSRSGMLNKYLFIFVLLFSASSFASELIDEIVLAPGRSYDWPIGSSGQVRLANGAIVQAREISGGIRITGRKKGSTTLQAGTNRVEVRVVSDLFYRDYDRLQRFLIGRRGLKIKTDGESMRIRGRLLRAEDWLQIAALTEPFKTPFYFEASIDPKTQKELTTRFYTLLKEARLPQLALAFSPAASVAIPTIPADLKSRATAVLGRYGFRLESSESALSLEPLVRVRILVAEVRRKQVTRIGVQWPAAIQGQLLPSLILPNESLLVSLNALEERGLGHVLASPTLLCRSGKEAQFLAGGEFPIKIAGFKSQDVVWKRYGVLLKISPKADLSGHMSIGVETEVSMIDPSQTVDGLPGLLTNRIETHFDLSSSRTIALSGLIKREWSEASQGLPGLSSIPILGALFSSRDYRDGKTELMIFVTPEIVASDEGEAS